MLSLGGCSTLSSNHLEVSDAQHDGARAIPPLAHRPYSSEPELLRDEVAAVCRHSEAVSLEALSADLSLSGVDAADATEALLRANCAPIEQIVTEMIARADDAAIDRILERALLLGGSGALARIERAAIAGLERRSELLDAGERGALRETLVYGLRYFPSNGAGRIQSAVAMNALLEQTLPGFGLYTFVLPGRGLRAPGEQGARRHAELLRLIETYASAGQEGEDERSHVFIVPVYANYSDLSLFEQTAPELAEFIRMRLGRVLRAQGHEELAQRLETGTGPFLLTSLEPHLLEQGADAARLLLDLSELGVESFYSLVDDYDRTIPGARAGRSSSLALLRERVLEDTPRRARRWIFLIGQRTEAAHGISLRGIASTPV